MTIDASARLKVGQNRVYKKSTTAPLWPRKRRSDRLPTAPPMTRPSAAATGIVGTPRASQATASTSATATMMIGPVRPLPTEKATPVL